MPIRVTDPVRLGEVKLPSGRRLGWAEWGPEAGPPVLYCPGAATSRWLGLDGDLVDRLAIRLVALDRPGLGASDPLPGRGFADWTRDVRDLLALRGLPVPALVGFSQGAPFALACAAAGLASAVAVVSGTDELAHPSVSTQLPPELRLLVADIAADPLAAEAFFRGFGDAARMWDFILATSGAADRSLYSEPEFARAFRRALAEGLAQGPDGYARDAVLAMGRWSFDLAAIAVPVDLWYGAGDTSAAHSPDHGATLVTRIPGARRHVIADAGGALPWTHTDAILRTLLARIACAEPTAPGPRPTGARPHGSTDRNRP